LEGDVDEGAGVEDIDEEDTEEEEDAEEEEESHSIEYEGEEVNDSLDVTLTDQLLEPLERVGLHSSLSATLTEEGGSFFSNTVDDEMCDDVDYSADRDKHASASIDRLLKRMTSEESNGKKTSSGSDCDEDDERPESPFYVPSSSSPDICDDAISVLNTGSSDHLQPMDSIYRTAAEDEESSVSSDRLSGDDSGHCIRLPLTLSPSFQSPDSNCSVMEGPPIYERCLTCHKCEAEVILPRLYWESNRAAGLAFYCDDCLTHESGHADCQEPDCTTCLTLAEELCRRAVVSYNFQNGTLEVEEQEQDESYASSLHL
jgi:hypothetical protein